VKLQLTVKFLHRVRIHGGEFDSSARAMNRAEGSNSLQADLRKFRGSTFERKQMSTTIKRVALVAVAALGLGVMSVAPSQAAAQLDSISVSAATAAQVTGETLTAGSVVVTSTLASTNADTLTVTASIVTGPAYSQPILALKETTTAFAAASGSVATVNPQSTGSTVTQATGKFYLYLNAPTVAGTYVVRLTPTGGTNAVATTVSITVTAAVVAPVSATYSTVAMNTTNCSAGAVWQYNNCYAAGGSGAGTYTYAIATDTVTATASLSAVTLGTVDGALLASFLLDQKNGASNTMASTVPWTVAITSGPGKVSMGGRIVSAKSVTESIATTGVDGYQAAGTTKSAYFISDGTAGTSVITFTAGGVLIATRTISVVGAATGYVFGTPSKGSVGVGETASVTITGVDSLGTTTGAASVYAFSSDATVATVNSTQASTVVITGVKSGKATITVGNASTIATSTITKTLDVTVGALTAKTVALSFDNATPQPGEKVTVTVTATDASGNAVGDGTRALFSSTGLTTSLAVQGSTLPSTANVDLVGGKATYSFYAPTGTGTLTLSATEGTATDSTTKAAITGTVTVINSSVDAATDAANEAAQAASDATDAALAAADAADAATTKAQEAVDAVATLSAQVSKMITALKAQITTLTNLVIKIQKKVKA
jgi:trimeric autotransporter adhesin